MQIVVAPFAYEVWCFSALSITPKSPLSSPLLHINYNSAIESMIWASSLYTCLFSISNSQYWLWASPMCHCCVIQIIYNSPRHLKKVKRQLPAKLSLSDFGLTWCLQRQPTKTEDRSKPHYLGAEIGICTFLYIQRYNFQQLSGGKSTKNGSRNSQPLAHEKRFTVVLEFLIWRSECRTWAITDTIRIAVLVDVKMLEAWFFLFL